MSDDVKDLNSRLVLMDFLFENQDAEMRRRYFLMRMAIQNALEVLPKALKGLPVGQQRRVFIETAMRQLSDGLRRSKAPSLEEGLKMMRNAGGL